MNAKNERVHSVIVVVVVRWTIPKSKMNKVVAGYFKGILGVENPRDGEHSVKSIAVVNEHALQAMASVICEDFSNESLQEPEIEMIPHMREVDMANYYKGSLHVENPRDGILFRDRVLKDSLIATTLLQQLLCLSEGEHHVKSIAVVNEHAPQAMASVICEDFSNESLQEPEIEMIPQMREVDMANYYKGSFHVENPRDDVAVSCSQLQIREIIQKLMNMSDGLNEKLVLNQLIIEEHCRLMTEFLQNRKRFDEEQLIIEEHWRLMTEFLQNRKRFDEDNKKKQWSILKKILKHGNKYGELVKLRRSFGVLSQKQKIQTLLYYRTKNGDDLWTLIEKAEAFAGTMIEQKFMEHWDEKKVIKGIANMIPDMKWMRFVRLELHLGEEEMNILREQYAVFSEDQKDQILECWITRGKLPENPIDGGKNGKREKENYTHVIQVPQMEDF